MNLSKEDLKQLTETINEVSRIMIADLHKNFKLLDQGDVDGIPWYTNGIPWYTIQIQNQEIWFWLTQQEGKWWHYTCPNRNTTLVSMEERVYLALVMKWS